jgi:uncharacterized protein YndB with AHSA1/START domain
VARIEAVTHVEAPRHQVWDLLVDWERQVEWMVDLRAVEVLTDQRDGPGVTIRCRTDILGVVVNDHLAVTEWEEGAVLGMRHLGRLIRGVGAFELADTAYGTRLLWWEEAEVPLGAVGDAIAGVAVVPWVERTFRRSLAGFKSVCERGQV